MVSETRPSTVWRKSSRSGSGGGQCVEIAAFTGLVAVRDSKAPDGPVLAVRPSAFRRLAEDIRRGQHDI